MAVRKQNFDDNDDRSARNTKRLRLTFDVSPELRQRIKLAALKNNLSVSEYLGRTLEDVVPEEVSLTQRQRQPITRETLEHILQVREEIMEHTKGRVFEDSTEIIRQMREERSRELDQL